MLPSLGPGPASSRVTEHPGPAAVCSAKRCGEPALWALHWNNPKLHSPDRRKTWLACGQHRGYLGEFLDHRGFLREVTPIESP